MNNNIETKIKHDSNNKFSLSIWLVVVLLLLLVILSGILTYSIVSSFSDGEYDVITLVPGDDGKGELPDFTIKPDSNGGYIWESESSIDLFKSSYTNEFGEVTVESSDGRPIIAPGTSNIYTFSLKNSGDYSMDFVLSLNGLFNLADYNLPFQVRLRSDNTWLAGNHNTWVAVSELKNVEIMDTIDRGKFKVFVLEWQWPFESNDEMDKALSDLNDTIIGNQGSLTDVEFSLTINTKAYITDGSYPYNQDGLLMLTRIIPAWLLFGILILLISGLFTILFLLLFRKRKREEEVLNNSINVKELSEDLLQNEKNIK